MSRISIGPVPKPKVKKPDRRIASTRSRLGAALISLIESKPIDSIKVQEILDRAGVSRSTFYTHYKDKDDLLLTDVADFFERVSMSLSRMNDPSDRVMPVTELFAHVGEARSLLDALTASGRLQVVLEIGQESFARGIERRLAALPRARNIPAQRRSALSHAYAGALVSLLMWWIRRGLRGSPQQMDDLFHRIVWSKSTSLPPA